MFKYIVACFVATLLIAGRVRAETITVATYNIELFHEHFPPAAKDWTGDEDWLSRLRAAGDKDNWLASQVILDPKLSPDLLAIEECCEQDELDKFNKGWLNGAYETVIVFPGNSTRHQSLGMLIKPAFKVLERNDQYYLEKDSGGGNERGDRLFARGPAFVKIQSPSGYQFWVGVTHQKSKYGNNVDVTRWRLREAKRTHEIMKDLEHAGPANVVLLGDMNDELGIQEYEQEAGGDVIAALVGPPADGFALATKSLVDSGKISYGGYWKTDHRGFIDQIVISPEMKNLVEEVNVFTDGVAQAASDHYPVYIRIDTPSTQPSR